MEFFKSAALFALVCVVFAFHMRLYTDNQGMLYSQIAEADGWHVKCRYYTAFHFYDVQMPVQTGCQSYAPAQPANRNASR